MEQKMTPLKSLLEFGLDKQSTLNLEKQKCTQQLIDIEQSIEVSSFSIAGSIVHTATPLLSSYAYREVEFPHGVEQSLLGGTVRVYEHEPLVGQTLLRSTQSGQPFSVGMVGMDGR